VSRRFHPKSRASTDQAPGPSSARAAPTVPRRIEIHESPGCEKRSQNARIATSIPATGVHRPANKNIPAPIASRDNMGGPIDGPPHDLAASRSIIATPATTRSRSRPAPGQPWANVEYNRRKGGPCLDMSRLGNPLRERKPQ